MTFAYPGWLALLILLPLLAVAAVLAFRMKRKQWTAFVAPRLRATLLRRGNPLPRWLAVFFLLLACSALIVAIARPQGDAGTATEKTMGRNVMIALDISRSMRVPDVKPDRLAQAKVIIYELLEELPNERIGLIAFAGDAYPYAPLTIDHSAVREITEQIDENWAPLGGSDLPAAVHLATETLKKTGQKNNALVIISDGEEVTDGDRGDLEGMIAAAERAGVYIIAIGVGTDDGGYVPDPYNPNGQMIDRSGRTVISRLQADTLRRLAEGTKGRFSVATSGQDIPELVKSVISGMDAFEMEGRERRISIEFYQWLVFPAIVFLMLSIIAGTRWKGIRAATAVLVMGGFVTLQAPASEATQAMKALEEHRYEDARDAYHQLADKASRQETRARYQLGEGTAAYRGGDFRSARSAFSGALLSHSPSVQASGHLGIGNTLFQLGWQGLSGETYPTDPEDLPDLNRFDTIVKEALAKMRESDAPEDGDSQDFVKMEALITNWSDAVRHYDSSIKLDPASPAAANRDMTLTFLKRLNELLDEEQQQAEESMPQEQPAPSQPPQDEGDGEPQEGDDKGSEEPKDQGEQGGEKDEDKDGSGDDEEQKDKDADKGDKDEKKDEGDKGDKGENPNETPEERAHRILKENADLEKGPLTPGRREFRSAEKDW